MATLYRKYRPQNFAEVVGQNHIKLTLEHEITSNKIAHAYLFCGPRAVGKTTISRVFSKSINCLNRKEDEYEPCNKCDVCIETNLGRNLDIIEIDAASHTGVDNVRDNVISVSRHAPSRSKYKVFIIDEVHMLSASAFNALLKTLEEPTVSAIFILCTTEVHKIPATIISRCQRFDFKRINMSEMVKRLDYIAHKEDISVERSILESIARQSEGHMRDAESLFGQVISIGGKEITQAEADLVLPRSDLAEAIKLVSFLANKDAGGAIGLVNKLIEEGVELKRFANDLIELLRKIMLAKVSPILAEKLGLELGENLDIETNKISKNLELAQIVVIIEKFMKAKNDIKSSFIAQLPLEIAITELCIEITSNSPQSFNSPVRSIISSTPAPRPSTPTINQVNSTPITQSIPSASPNLKMNAGLPVIEKIEGQNVNTQNSAEGEYSHKYIEPKTGEAIISRETIRERWSEVLIRVKKYNHSLPFILMACDPRSVNGNQVCVAFKYKFHKERIADTKIKEIMERVFFEVFNLPLTIEAIIDEMMEGNGRVVVSNPVAEVKQEQSENISSSEDNYINDNDNNQTEYQATLTNSVVNEGGKGMIDDLLKTFGGKVVG